MPPPILSHLLFFFYKIPFPFLFFTSPLLPSPHTHRTPGTTTMDPVVSHIAAVAGHAAPGTLILDPFCGTGNTISYTPYPVLRFFCFLSNLFVFLLRVSQLYVISIQQCRQSSVSVSLSLPLSLTLFRSLPLSLTLSRSLSLSLYLLIGSLLLACASLGARVIGSDIDGDCLGLAPVDVPLKVRTCVLSRPIFCTARASPSPSSDYLQSDSHLGVSLLV